MELNTKVKRRSLVAAGIGALAALGAGTAMLLRRPGTPGVLQAGRVQGELPLNDPEHKAWKSADSLAVRLLPQQMFYPRLQQATLQEMSVRALFNGQQLGFLIEWGDDKPDDLESIVTFRDAVAVMLPMNPAAERPPVFMGMAGKPVYILQWKASWQRDVDRGFQDVEQSYPRWFNDVYPGHPDLERLGMTAEAARAFYPGLAAGNILSRQQRTSPVEELVAEGYGTLTTLPVQRALGRGVSARGKWKVSLGTPAAGEDVPALKPGSSVPVAFAVWDGGKQQRGGRKHFADWIQVSLPGGA